VAWYGRPYRRPRYAAPVRQTIGIGQALVALLALLVAAGAFYGALITLVAGRTLAAGLYAAGGVCLAVWVGASIAAPASSRST